MRAYLSWVNLKSYQPPSFVRFKPDNKKLRKTPKYKEYLRQMLFEEHKSQEKLQKK